MKALVFVYSSASFRIGGSYPLKQFKPGQRMLFADAPVTVQPPSDPVRLDQGIYVLFSDADDVRPAISPLDETRGVAFDIVEYGGKDQWPDPASTTITQTLAAMGGPAPTGDEFDKLVASIRAQFPDLPDDELRTFASALGRAEPR